MKSNSSPSKLEARRKIVVKKDETKNNSTKTKQWKRGGEKLCIKSALYWMCHYLFLVMHASLNKTTKTKIEHTKNTHIHTYTHTHNE